MQLTESQKRVLKDEIVDLRMHLANAENQANKVIGLLPTKYGLPCKVRWHIREADDELCRIAKKMGLGAECTGEIPPTLPSIQLLFHHHNKKALCFYLRNLHVPMRVAV